MAWASTYLVILWGHLTLDWEKKCEFGLFHGWQVANTQTPPQAMA